MPDFKGIQCVVWCAPIGTVEECMHSSLHGLVQLGYGSFFRLRYFVMVSTARSVGLICHFFLAILVVLQREILPLH